MKSFRLISALVLTASFALASCGADPTNLEAGNYQLLCNIAGHYKNGMYAAFIVE